MVCETHHFHIPRNTAMTTVTKRKTAAVELKALLGEEGGDKLRRLLQELLQECARRR